MAKRFLGVALTACRIVVGGLFVLAGATKAYDPASFAIEIQNYQLLPWVGCVLLALFLPWVEVLAGGSLFVKRFERGALLLISAMLVAYSAALLSAMMRGLSIDCGCFGRAIPSTGTLWPLIRNGGLMILTGLLWIWRARASGPLAGRLGQAPEGPGRGG